MKIMNANNFIKKYKMGRTDTTIILATSQGHILCINLGMPSSGRLNIILGTVYLLRTTYSELYLSVYGSRHTD